MKKIFIMVLLLTSISFAKNDKLIFGVNPNLKVRVNEDDKDYRPGIGINGTFLYKAFDHFAFGLCPEYDIWSLKFEDESVTYNVHSLGILISTRAILSRTEKLSFYIQLVAGPDVIITSYGRQGFSHLINKYCGFGTNFTTGINLFTSNNRNSFNLALKSGFFTEKDIDDSFIWIGFSIGMEW